MGAGKGQQQRVKVSTSSGGANQKTVDSLEGARAYYSYEKWYTWIQAKGIERIKLFSYYLGNERAKTKKALTDEEQKFLWNEVFADAVNAGAIKLSISKKVDPQDFSFKPEYVDLNHYLIVEHAPTSVKGRVPCVPYNLVRNHTLQDEYRLNNIFYSLCDAIQDAAKSS